MQQEHVANIPAQEAAQQQENSAKVTFVGDPTEHNSQITFDELVKEFNRIDATENPVRKQYELESYLKKSDVDREAYIKLFELYQKQEKEKQWLSHWYLAFFARLEKLIEGTATTLNEMDIFKIVQQIGNVAIIFTVASVIGSALPNKDKEIEEAWKVVESKDVGRRTRYAAIEKLYKYNQSFDYLNLPAGAYLPKINLVKATLSYSVLPKAILPLAKLQQANLPLANLQQANLWGAELQQANLWRANLQQADLVTAKLQEAKLSGANLRLADLGGADLQGANLVGANLQKGNFRLAKLREAMYTDRNAKPEVCAKYTLNHPCPTIFSNNFDPKAAGMVLLK